MAKKVKWHQQKGRTKCVECRNCFMLIRDVGRKYLVVCKKVPKSMEYKIGHYEGMEIPRYCSMFEDKRADMLYYTTRGEK